MSMLGPEGITRLLVGRLHERLPLELAAVRESVGATESDLPDFQALQPYVPDIATIEDWPAVFVTYIETNPSVGGSSRLLTSGPEADSYQYRYRNRVYVFARGVNAAETDLRIKRYALAVRQSLIRHKSLTSLEGQGGSHARIESDIREAMSDVGLDPTSKRFIGGGYVQVDVVANETLEAIEGPLGQVGQIDVHPALR